MPDELIPRPPRRKKQPSANVMREQLALAADEIIRLRETGWFIEAGQPIVLVDGVPAPPHDFDPPTGIITFRGEMSIPTLAPRPLPWWRRLLRRIP